MTNQPAPPRDIPETLTANFGGIVPPQTLPLVPIAERQSEPIELAIDTVEEAAKCLEAADTEHLWNQAYIASVEARNCLRGAITESRLTPEEARMLIELGFGGERDYDEALQRLATEAEFANYNAGLARLRLIAKADAP